MSDTTARERRPNSSSGERIASVGIGLAMLLAGSSRRGLGGVLLGMAGAAFMLRGLTGYRLVKGLSEGEQRVLDRRAPPHGRERPPSMPTASAELKEAGTRIRAANQPIAFDRVMTGESLVGEGNEVAHVDLIMGPRGSTAETAFCNALTNNKDGFTSLLAVVAPNLMCKPPTILFNKVTIKNARQAVQMFGPAQHAVAKAVADCVQEGTIPQDEADNLFICVGVFIHWEAQDDAKIQDYNYRATKEAIERAVRGIPTPAEVLQRKAEVIHPFAA